MNVEPEIAMQVVVRATQRLTANPRAKLSTDTLIRPAFYLAKLEASQARANAMERAREPEGRSP
jgi:hypothetical protein